MHIVHNLKLQHGTHNILPPVYPVCEKHSPTHPVLFLICILMLSSHTFPHFLIYIIFSFTSVKLFSTYTVHFIHQSQCNSILLLNHMFIWFWIKYSLPPSLPIFPHSSQEINRLNIHTIWQVRLQFYVLYIKVNKLYECFMKGCLCSM